MQPSKFLAIAAILFVCIVIVSAATHITSMSPGVSFSYGVSFDASLSSATTNKFTHVYFWGGADVPYNQYWDGASVAYAIKWNIPQLIFGYAIAYYARATYGIQDCNVQSTNNLCTDGAKVLRNSADWAGILNRYKVEAEGIAASITSAGKDASTYPTYWCIEPDFYQYSTLDGSQQSGGGISPYDLANTYFKGIVDTIHAALPNAYIGMDISPWVADEGYMSQWFGAFENQAINFMCTSGGTADAESDLVHSSNTMTWTQAQQLFGGISIVADAGYGVGGSADDNYSPWLNQANIQARHNQGVIGVSISASGSSLSNYESALTAALLGYSSSMTGLPSVSTTNFTTYDYTLTQYNISMPSSSLLEAASTAVLAYGNASGCFNTSLGYYPYVSTSNNPTELALYIVNPVTTGSCSEENILNVITSINATGTLATANVSTSYPQPACLGTYNHEYPDLLDCTQSQCLLRCGALIPCTAAHKCSGGFKCDTNTASITADECVNASMKHTLSFAMVLMVVLFVFNP